MKAFLLFLLLAFGGLIYFLTSSPPEEEIEDFLVQEEVIFEEFDEPSPPPPSPSNLPGLPPLPQRKVAKAEVKEKNEESDINLELVQAINRQKFGGVLTGTNVQGSLNIFDNFIQNLNISISTPAGQNLGLEIGSVELGVGGSFSVEQEEEFISGLIIESGDGKYTLRFATGPLAGSALLFEKEKSFEEKQAMEQAQMLQAQALAQRQEVEEMNEMPDRSIAQMNEREDEVMPEEVEPEMDVAQHEPEYSEYDMEERAETSGYTL